MTAVYPTLNPIPSIRNADLHECMKKIADEPLLAVASTTTVPLAHLEERVR